MEILNRTYGCYHIPSHQLFTQGFDVRKTWPVIEGGQPVSSDDSIELCLCPPLHMWEED